MLVQHQSSHLHLFAFWCDINDINVPIFFIFDVLSASILRRCGGQSPNPLEPPLRLPEDLIQGKTGDGRAVLPWPVLCWL